MLWILQFVRRHPFPLLLLAFPWFLLVLNPNWPFGNGGNCDPWYYFGHFRDYPRLFLNNPSYDGERLPMILPGHLFHILFRPVIAEVLLHVALFYTAVFSLYYTVKQVQDQQTAQLTTILLACHSFFIGPIGWDYIDGFGITYYLLAIAFLTRALTSSAPGLWLACAGAASAALFYTYPLWLLFMPFFAFYYGVPTWKNRRHSLLTAPLVFALFFLIGFATLTILLAAFNYVVIGTVWFYKGSIQLMFALDTRPEWTNRDFRWIASATWLVFPFLTCLGCLAYALRNRLRCLEPQRIFTLLFLANLGYCFLAFSYMTVIKGNRILEFDYYANSLVPPMFLALGSAFLLVPRPLRLRIFIPVLIVAVTICLLPFSKHWTYPEMLSSFRVVQQHGSLLTYYLVLPCVVGLCGLVLRVCFPQSMAAWVGCVGALCIAGFGLTPEKTKSAWIRTYRGPALYARVCHAVDTINAQSDANKVPFFWFSLTERSSLDYLCINRSLRAHTKIDWTFPALAPQTIIPPDSVILILTENKDIPSAAEYSLRRVGLSGKLVSQVRIAKKHVAYWMTFLQVVPAESNLSARR
jgi:hypothetical protein